ncbi:hypothetical protein [Haloactinopolyspora alba]|uniref:hypothetical protein n=1 Tax=Haloactinopolyspora alba TaxID=648780 RepID=UPI0013ECBA02|nr:hypothetical protein [Haloactinopolyspora alba]
MATAILRSVYPGRMVVIDHIVTAHPELDDDVWLLAWTAPDGRIICQACPDAPHE